MWLNIEYLFILLRYLFIYLVFVVHMWKGGSTIGSQEADGFKKALRKLLSMRWNMPSSKTPGLNFVMGSALKKSKCLAVTMDGVKSVRSASVISKRDCAKRIVLEPTDLPTRVRPIQVIECCRMEGSMCTITSSRNHALKLFKVRGQYSKSFGILPPAIVIVQSFLDLSFMPSFQGAHRQDEPAHRSTPWTDSCCWSADHGLEWKWYHCLTSSLI